MVTRYYNTSEEAEKFIKTNYKGKNIQFHVNTEDKANHLIYGLLIFIISNFIFDNTLIGLIIM